MGLGPGASELSSAQRIALGANIWSQFTTWERLLAAAHDAEEFGYDTLWTSDHLYPVVGQSRGPVLEGWMVSAAWAQATQRVRIGLLVCANTFREPTLVAKMATTLDHVSGGRAIMGIGAGWFEPEHIAYGIRFGRSAGERLRWLGEALPVIRDMLRGESGSASGSRYSAIDARNDPPPMQPRIPMLVGGDGEQVTLRLVAQYGDACNVGFHLGPDLLLRKDRVLRRHCAEWGRSEQEVERTTEVRVVVIRDSERAARREYARMREQNGRAPDWREQPIGTPEQVVERLEPVVKIGYRHLVCGFPFPHDAESMARLVTEVKPRLERALGTGVASGAKRTQSAG